ncbi:hypothetical protein V8C86DRAFT_3023583 [Haematococcus lacustris]
MPPKQTGSAMKAGTKHSRSLSDSDTGSTPAFKSRELPKSRRLVAPATCTSPGASGSAVTGCKYARWQDATDAIVGAVLMGLLETLGYVSKDLKYDDIVDKIHKCGHNTVSKKTRSTNEAAPSSVKKENEDKYSQWDAVWGKFFTAQRRPSSWEKLIALALKFKKGILPDPQYFTVKSLFVTDAMAKHIDEGFQQLVADKDITLKPSQLRDTIDADLLANRVVRYGGASQFSDTASEPCITAQVVDVFFTKEEQQAFPRAKTFAEQGLITEEWDYLKQWDDELPTQLITGLKQIAKAAARKAKVEAEAEQKVQEKAAKRARSVARPPQHFEP